MKRRVVISGMGCVTPIGNDVDSLWNSIKNKKCGIDKITHFDTSDYKVKLAAEIKDLDTKLYFENKDLKFNDDFVKYARISAKQAINDSKIDISKIDQQRFGVIFASGIGGIQTIEKCDKTLNEKGNSRVSPFFIPMSLINLAAGNIAIDVQAKGYVSAVVTACAASSNAIGEAYLKIRDNYQDIMLAGGSEAAITPLGISGFQAMKALCISDDKNNASIPFDVNRSGFVMGEGAGCLVLEEYEHAKKRGAHIYAEICGYGTSCDAFHITAPGDEAKNAMLNALNDANISADCIDYINAHGTSTKLNDAKESIAINNIFKHPVLVSSTKSYTGHLLGASGVVEAIISIEALNHQVVPPTINTTNVDADIDLNLVLDEVVEKDLVYVMSNSLGFGGHNASLIFKKVGD